MGKYIDHACEGCGKVRKVRQSYLRRGVQRYCQQCQGKVAAEKRRVRRNTHTAVAICKECSKEYQASGADTGYCSAECESKAAARGRDFRAVKRAFLMGGLIPPPITSACLVRKSTCEFEQMGLPYM